MNRKLPIGTPIIENFRLGDKVIVSEYNSKIYIATIIGCNLVNNDNTNIAIDIKVNYSNSEIIKDNISNSTKKNVVYIDSDSKEYSWINSEKIELLNKAIIVDYTSLKDEYIAKIVYQDYNIFPRGNFYDKELNIHSSSAPQYVISKKTIFLQGTDESLDDKLIRIPKEDIKDFEKRIDRLNEKYVTNIHKLIIHPKEDIKTVTIRNIDFPNRILLEDYELYKIKKRLDKIETILNIEEEKC